VLLAWLIEALIALPWLLFEWPRSNKCEKCGFRLKYVSRPGGKFVQCVMCEQVWRIEKGKRLRPVDGQG
jgi:hypothetical protein